MGWPGSPEEEAVVLCRHSWSVCGRGDLLTTAGMHLTHGRGVWDRPTCVAHPHARRRGTRASQAAGWRRACVSGAARVQGTCG